MSERTARRIDLGSVALSVTEIGDGPPILFLHGFPENGGAWRKVAGELSSRFRCILPDQRGYGLSDKPGSAEDYSIDCLLGDIDALADSLHLETFRLAGHDWGGLLAYWFAARWPERVSHLIIANAPHPARFQLALINDPAQRLAAQYITRLRQPGSEKSVSGATQSMVDWYRAAPFVVPAPGETAVMPDWATAKDLAINVPTLILWGMRDPVLLPVLLEGLEAYIADPAIMRFADAGHDCIHEESAAIAAAIAAFLA